MTVPVALIAINGVSASSGWDRICLAAADRARDAYVRRLYRTDPTDTRHYHLVIDSTALPLDTVTDVILRALSSSPAPLADGPNAAVTAQ